MSKQTERKDPQEIAETSETMQYQTMQLSELAKEAKSNPIAQYVAGNRCSDTSDPELQAKEVEMYKASAAQSYPPAQFNLAALYHSGQGALKDTPETERFAKAKELYESAIKQRRHAKSYSNLAVMHEFGQGVPTNPQYARELYELSASLGYSGAQKKMAAEHGFNPTGLSYAGLLTNNDPNAHYDLAMGFLEKGGINKIKQAYNHLELALAGNLEQGKKAKAEAEFTKIKEFFDDLKLLKEVEEMSKNPELLDRMLENKHEAIQTKFSNYTQAYNKCSAYVRACRDRNIEVNKEGEEYKIIMNSRAKIQSLKEQWKANIQAKQKLATAQNAENTPKSTEETVLAEEAAPNLPKEEPAKKSQERKNDSGKEEKEALKSIAERNSEYEIQYAILFLTDRQKAYEYQLEKMKEDTPAAQNGFAMRLLNGEGIAKNPKEAERLLKLAVAEGYAAAQFNLAEIYVFETAGITQNFDEALRLYKLAENQGYSGAANKIKNVQEFQKLKPKVERLEQMVKAKESYASIKKLHKECSETITKHNLLLNEKGAKIMSDTAEFLAPRKVENKPAENESKKEKAVKTPKTPSIKTSKKNPKKDTFAKTKAEEKAETPVAEKDDKPESAVATDQTAQVKASESVMPEMEAKSKTETLVKAKTENQPKKAESKTKTETQFKKPNTAARRQNTQSLQTFLANKPTATTAPIPVPAPAKAAQSKTTVTQTLKGWNVDVNKSNKDIENKHAKPPLILQPNPKPKADFPVLGSKPNPQPKQNTPQIIRTGKKLPAPAKAVTLSLAQFQAQKTPSQNKSATLKANPQPAKAPRGWNMDLLAKPKVAVEVASNSATEKKDNPNTVVVHVASSADKAKPAKSAIPALVPAAPQVKTEPQKLPTPSAATASQAAKTETKAEPRPEWLLDNANSFSPFLQRYVVQNPLPKTPILNTQQQQIYDAYQPSLATLHNLAEREKFENYLRYNKQHAKNIYNYVANCLEQHNFQEAQVYSPTLFMIGQSYITGLFGNNNITETRNEAIKYFEQAAELDHLGSQLYLVKIYCDKGDFAKAKDHIVSAAQRQHPHSQYHCALLHFGGVEVTQDPQQAEKLLSLITNKEVINEAHVNHLKSIINQQSEASKPLATKEEFGKSLELLNKLQENLKSAKQHDGIGYISQILYKKAMANLYQKTIDIVVKNCNSYQDQNKDLSAEERRKFEEIKKSLQTPSAATNAKSSKPLTVEKKMERTNI